jgi:hypothetical protein
LEYERTYFAGISRGRADTGLHADPTWRQIGEAGIHLATRPLLAQAGTVPILANDMKRVLAYIHADYGR